MITPAKRKAMEKLIYDTYNAMDDTGRNAEHYKNIFSNMSDAKFEKYFKDLFADPNKYLIFTSVDYEIDINIDNLQKAANVLGIPLMERIACPHYTMDKNNVIVTKEEVPVGYVHIKRTQQTVAKKNGLSTTIDIRSSVTGQVTGADKNGRESDIENYMVVNMGGEYILRELNGPKADDIAMKNQMLAEIATKGYLSLEDLDSDPVNKTTLNTVNVYLLGMGFNSDLVTKGLMLPYTLNKDS